MSAEEAILLLDEKYNTHVKQPVALWKYFREAAAGKRVVRLYTKGHRAMNQNTFCFMQKNGKKRWASVPTVCLMAGIDPEHLTKIFSLYKQEERITGHSTGRPDSNQRVWSERYQIITNLLPFPEIHWYREINDHNVDYTELPGNVTRRNDEPVDLPTVLTLCVAYNWQTRQSSAST